MSVKKIYDASVLINILQDIDSSEIMILWNKNPRYEQWTTYEINNEIKRLGRNKLDELIHQEIQSSEYYLKKKLFGKVLLKLRIFFFNN